MYINVYICQIYKILNKNTFFTKQRFIFYYLCIYTSNPYTHTYKHTYKHTYMHRNIQIFMQTSVHTHTHIHTYTYIYIYIYIYTHTHTHIYIYIYTHARAHTRSHIHVHSQRNLCTQALTCALAHLRTYARTLIRVCICIFINQYH
jgi:hypothetical protein